MLSVALCCIYTIPKAAQVPPLCKTGIATQCSPRRLTVIPHPTQQGTPRDLGGSQLALGFGSISCPTEPCVHVLTFALFVDEAAVSSLHLPESGWEGVLEHAALPGSPVGFIGELLEPSALNGNWPWLY